MRFQTLVLVHLDSAYNLARWMLRSEHDAQDVVQEACLRAFRAFDSFRGDDGRCWLLAIVRNTCRSWLDRNRRDAPGPLPDEDDIETPADPDADPQVQMLRRAGAQEVRAAIESLPGEFREVIVMRELEGLTYKEIAAVAGVPVGTVMSRLARGRERLERKLAPRLVEGGLP
ncbi:MAG TPA: sigma-70 family RNA polymerase sigma factor [Tepidisphaeraceae bacterium]|jgi:RNA polymerase sigma-70 factor (ECF subfamily)